MTAVKDARRNARQTQVSKHELFLQRMGTGSTAKRAEVRRPCGNSRRLFWQLSMQATDLSHSVGTGTCFAIRTLKLLPQKPHAKWALTLGAI